MIVEPVPFLLPGGVWEVVFDSTQPRGIGRWHGQGGGSYALPARCVVMLAAAGHTLALPP